MEIRRIPKLRIEIGEDDRSLVITDSDGTLLPPIPCNFSEQHRREYRLGLKRTLDKMKLIVTSKKELTIADASAALEELDIRGRSTMKQIFGDIDKVEEAVDVFQKGVPSWRSAGEPVTITAPAKLGHFIPIDFLPLFEVSEWPVDCDLPTLEAAARRFPSFSAIIRREIVTRIDQNLVIENDPKLPIRCFVENSLKGAKDEIGFFEAHENHIDIDGPWPEVKLPFREFSKAMADYLRYGNKTFKGLPRTPVDQIQHFTCHCVIDEVVSADSTLRLSKGNDITIKDLQAQYTLPDPRPRPQFGPLIFLNACGTAEIDPMAINSFPKFFLLENKNRGFIGTETNVPDRFAAEFSERFYRGLLGGLGVGRAVHEAKWSLLRDRYNPLGILYTVYADPNLHVRNPVKLD